MKKSKLSLGLVSCLLSVGALAGCDVGIKSSKNGVLFSYTVEGNSEPIEVKADDLLGDYYNDSTKYQAIYDTINSVIVRNYFSKDRGTISYHGKDIPLGLPQMDKINEDAEEKVQDDIDKAHTNADANNTKWKDEFEKICESKGVKTEDELREKYVEELQKETFDDNFYTYYIEEIKAGGEAGITYKDSYDNEKQLWRGYFTQELPYHVSHILIKLEDSAGTNYANGTISKDNAIKLCDVVDALGAPQAEFNDSFETIAHSYSEDTGSRDAYGDLGIMDYSTSYVNEFKLGVYAYENFYYADESRAKGSEIDLVTDYEAEGQSPTVEEESIAHRYLDAVKTSFDSDVPTIDKEVFAELREAADVDEDEIYHEPVAGGDTSVMPRNIIYNKYLNRHEVAFITGEAGDALDLDTTTKTVGYVKYYNGPLANTKPVLAAKVAGEWNPILVVRAGSDYQGIHFIVINRSAFEEGANPESPDVHPVSKSDYYTTFYPEQDYYPEVGDNRTYIDFSSDNPTKTRNRAEEFTSKLKSFDSDRLSKYIFKKFMKLEGIKISDEKLSKALENWIDRQIEKTEEDRVENWKKTWNEYIDTLVRQNSERNKLVPEVCKFVYKKGNSKFTPTFLGFDFDEDQVKEIKAAIKQSGWADANGDGITTDAEVEAYYAGDFQDVVLSDWFNKKGGICNDGKTHEE